MFLAYLAPSATGPKLVVGLLAACMFLTCLLNADLRVLVTVLALADGGLVILPTVLATFLAVFFTPEVTFLAVFFTLVPILVPMFFLF